MRILLVSDPPFVPSAYAIQSEMLARRLQADGHVVEWFGTTYYGRTLNMDGLRVAGGPGHLSGSDMMDQFAHRMRADFVLTVKDPYVYLPHALRSLSVPWVAVAPVDTEPLNLVTKDRLSYATQVIAITRHSQQMLRDEGIACEYAPLGLDLDFWTPGSKEEARAKLGIPRDVFCAAFVGVNNCVPSRKNLDQVLLAWEALTRQDANMRDAVLYLHTCISDAMGGIDAGQIINATQLPQLNWRATDQLQYLTGNTPRELVRDVYRAADVLINPASGGGFEMCGVEAQACGTPVISCAFTAMRETVWSGWTLPATDQMAGELVWHQLGGFRFRPNRGALVNALRMARERRQDALLRQQAIDGARQYEINRVYADYWRPAMANLARLLNCAILEDHAAEVVADAAD